MTQTLFTAKEAKNNFGKLLDEARRSPVAIQKNGRKVAYLLSKEEYDFTEKIIDAYWGEKARRAEKEGFLTVAETRKAIKRLLNA